MGVPGSTLNVALQEGEVPTVLLSGQVDFHNRHMIQEVFDEALASGCTRVVCDMTSLRYIDSSGLSVLIGYATSLSRVGGSVELVGVSPDVGRALTLCGAAAYFNSDILDLPVDRRSDRQVPVGKFWHVSQFSLPASPGSASIARGRVMDVLASLPVSISEAQDIIFAVGEGLANAIRHGCHCDPTARVTVRCVAGAGRLIIDISDPGTGFDPDAVPEPVPAPDLDGGMGIYIMRRLVDEVHFSFNGGTTLKLVKHIATVEGIEPERSESLSVATADGEPRDSAVVAV